MAKQKQQEKAILEREYIIPLRKETRKVPNYKRAGRAVKAIKKFLARHMKVYDRDLDKIKIDRYLNDEIWFRGAKKPPAKIKVKAIKYDNGLVKVELVDIPKVVKYKIDREKRKSKEVEKKTEEKKEKKLEEKVGEKTEEEKKEEIEKEKSTVESGLKQQKKQAKQIKHTESTGKKPVVRRKALAK
jgi:large subunit ribosomal protein L31e